ncbi:Uncharacterized protein PBTT_05284 [Plasmodiophora brassicae]
MLRARFQAVVDRSVRVRLSETALDDDLQAIIKGLRQKMSDLNAARTAITEAALAMKSDLRTLHKDQDALLKEQTKAQLQSKRK